MMAVTYRVRDWNRHYETAETRKLKVLRFCLMPNKHDGKGYRRVMAHPKACEVMSAWVLILQVASKCPVRGTLADEDGPLDADDLSIKTGMKSAAFVVAFDVLTDPKVGWLERDTSNLPESPEVPGDAPEVPGDAGRISRTKGREGNGINDASASCPETASLSAGPPADKALLTFPTDGATDSWDFRESLLAEYRDCYPHMDVMQQVRMALAWIKANPSKRKTAVGMRGFLTRWLNKAQNRGDGGNGKPGVRPQSEGRPPVELVKAEDSEAAHRRWLESRKRQGLPTNGPARLGHNLRLIDPPEATS